MVEDEVHTFKELQGNFSQAGAVAWIGLRPARKEPLTVVLDTFAKEGRGLVGDRTAEKGSENRQVTFIMAEHLATVAATLGRTHLDPGIIRRNVVTRGINLMALKGKRFRIGEAIFRLTLPCVPCSRMEENLGLGGYNAMRGHGGFCAVILQSGNIRVGDAIEALPD
jgi:MOSC domain-containing protein YiiM